MSRDDIIGLFVLLAIGTIIATLVNQASAVAGGFQKFSDVWRWAMLNAYGLDTTKPDPNAAPSKGNPNILGRSDLAS